MQRGGKSDADILAPALAALTTTTASVGRLELTTGDDEETLRGTGWLIRPDMVVTNRHVVAGLKERVASHEIDLRIDFLGEYGSSAELEFPVTGVEWFEPYESAPNLDLAFVRIDRTAVPELALAPLDLADETHVG